jgi:lipoate-protein ligase A
MKCFDLKLPTPEANLACDEALLDACEAGEGPELLRFWESDAYFVVLGCANHYRSEANLAECERAGAPLLRRCSGGGTVVQGPGCLNYSLILEIDFHPALAGIPQTNAYIMEKQAAAIQRLALGPVAISGTTDLTLNGLKFSGNAQRRRRKTLLFHGALLLSFDLDRIGRLLNMPSQQPEYRQNRSHGDFLTNLNIERLAIKAALRQEWGAVEDYDSVPAAAMDALIAEKYGRTEWNLRY